jgi:hypothetical protein
MSQEQSLIEASTTIDVAAAGTLLSELVPAPKNMIGKKMNRRMRNKATYRALRRGDGAEKIMNFMSRCGAVSGGVAGVACLERKYGI